MDLRKSFLEFLLLLRSRTEKEAVMNSPLVLHVWKNVQALHPSLFPSLDCGFYSNHETILKLKMLSIWFFSYVLSAFWACGLKSARDLGEVWGDISS